MTSSTITTSLLKPSTYDEPEEPYRPLVRHLKSAILIQAWPFLDEDPAYGRMMPKETDGLSHLLCDVCSTRRAVRVCDECPPPIPQLDASSNVSSLYAPTKPVKSHTTFCFPCFTRRHCNEENSHHDYREMASILTHLVPVNNDYLQCCECEEPATRKCQGILDDKQVDDLCHKLRSESLENVSNILAASRVGEERKLQLLVSQFYEGKSPSVLMTGSRVLVDIEHKFDPSEEPQKLTPAQLHAIRSLLERTRAECDECYCDNCYKDVHSGGKRSTHMW
eukprot:CAMPEP_0182440396 /NCGR_PEP_ID=MMETSP1167-20130531/87041_1 /TAXON_ID=2988 /ORGANISM="Mallomonas Sp, Strain CCMP3275" /LENGTH=278 /DNA_ID=CAMNT_0024634347 /DNA_START=508 /DNA_END=1340 /DNA_ORIENTATION=-